MAYTVRRSSALAGVLGLGVAAAALAAGVPALAEETAVQPVVTGPTCDPNAKEQGLETIVTGGTTTAAQWIDEREVNVPERPQIAEIEAAEWLPTPESK